MVDIFKCDECNRLCAGDSHDVDCDTICTDCFDQAVNDGTILDNPFGNVYVDPHEEHRLGFWNTV